MKKLLCLLIAFTVIFSFATFSKTFASSSTDPLLDELNKNLVSKGLKPVTKAELDQQLNDTITRAIEQGNALEKQGKNQYSVKIPVDKSGELGTIELVSKVSESSTRAFQKKDWAKAIRWQSPIFPINWVLNNNGTFTYGKNAKGYAVVNGVTATVDAGCTIPFSCTDSKSIERLDDSVVRIYGKGTYSGALTNGAVTYHGYLDVEVNGTGDVRVLRGTFGF